MNTLPALAATHHYALILSDSLEEISVEAELANPTVLQAPLAHEGDLIEAHTCDGAPLAFGSRQLSSRKVRCIRYRSKLRRFDERVDPDSALNTRPGQWLWLPELGADDRVQLTLKLPDGMQAFLPWKRREGTFEVLPSPGSGESIALFGNLHKGQIDLPGATLPLTYAGPPEHLSKVRTWLARAAGDVWQVAQRFPNPDATILVIDVPGRSGEPVPFGHVIRDGGETIRFFVQAESSLESLTSDWTATHEFAHLLMPYVNARWVSEGFASYYQVVLLTRRGVYSETEGWRRLVQAFASARNLKDPPSPMQSDSRAFWDVRMLIYWSGAALALMGDVALRAETNGTLSLDTSMAELSACCLPAARSRRPRALFEQLDMLTESNVMSRLFESYAHARGLPPVESLYEPLGIRIDGDRLELDDNAPLAHVRRQIMQRPSNSEKIRFPAATDRSLRSLP